MIRDCALVRGGWGRMGGKPPHFPGLAERTRVWAGNSRHLQFRQMPLSPALARRSRAAQV